MPHNPFSGYEPTARDIAKREGKRWRRAMDSAQRVAGEHAGEVSYRIGRYLEREGETLAKRTIGKQLSIRWFRSHCTTRVSIKQAGDKHHVLSGSVASQVFGKNDWRSTPPEAKVDAAKVYRDIMQRAIPGIQVERSIRVCDGVCKKGDRMLNDMPLVYTSLYPSLCKNFGGHWLCDDCEELARAGQPGARNNDEGADKGSSELTHAERMRANMTPGKRFDILQRDEFTCQSCGSSAPDVDLEVDHIKPVSKGGTNDPDNLQALCADCNRGKSDKRVTQMEMV